MWWSNNEMKWNKWADQLNGTKPFIFSHVIVHYVCYENEIWNMKYEIWNIRYIWRISFSNINLTNVDVMLNNYKPLM